ncbi:MAG TPA: flagellar motor protein MotB [Terriglobia bacterium]|nr:flagellar motor protein MotB [Terriglobia bacterium]
MSRRRKRHTAHANHERWLVSYADFITLLFAFFVVMFASSQVDKHKVSDLAAAIQVAFQKLAIFTPSSSQVNLLDTAAAFSNSKVLGEKVHNHDAGLAGPNESLPDPGQIRDELERALAEQLQKKQVSLRLTHEGLVISLQEIGFYDSGSATLKPESMQTVAKIAELLGNRREFIRVEGHTDNVPIHNAAFKSNWDLSTSRATGMIDLLINRFGFQPQRLSAAGYAEYHPIASNSSPETRGQNRRVDIVILNPQLWGLFAGGSAPAHSPIGAS